MIDTSDVRKMNMNAIRAVMWRGGEHMPPLDGEV